MKLRRFHRVLGIILFAWIVNASFTGMMRANASSLYWKERAPAGRPGPVSPPSVEIAKAFENAGKILSADAVIREISLKNVREDKPVYLVRAVSKRREERVLVDAQTGNVLSPVSEQEAVETARDYVTAGTEIESVTLLENFLPRKAQISRPAFRVRFRDPDKTEVFIDRDTSEMLYLLDRGRHFGLWMVKLHELEFFHLKRPALTVLGGAVILFAVSGLLLAFPRRQVRR